MNRAHGVNISTLGPMLVAVVVSGLSGCSSEAASIPIDGDDIGGTVTSAEGARSRRLGHRGDRRIRDALRENRRHGRSGSLSGSGSAAGQLFKVWVRGYGLADSAKSDAAPGKIVNLTANVAPDAAAALRRIYPAAYWYAMMKLPQAAGSCASAGQAQRVSDVDEEHGLRRLPSDGQSRDAHDSADARQVRLFARCMGATHSVRSGRRADDAHGDGSACRRADQISRRLDRSHRKGRAARIHSRRAQRRRTQRRCDGARLVRREGVHARSVGHRSAQPDRECQRQAVRRARAEHGSISRFSIR